MIKGLGALSPLPKPPPETSPMEVTFPPLPQPKLALDLATPEGCKAEFTWTLMAVRLLVPRRCRVYIISYSRRRSRDVHCT